MERVLKFLLVIFVLVSLFGLKTYVKAYTFAAAGDFANGTPFKSTVSGIASLNPDFAIALGDLAYTTAEQSWCGVWKSIFPNVVLISGNHDSGESSSGNINNYVTYCPYPLNLSPMTGTYGKQFYYDWPAQNPTTRFILVSAGLGGSYIGFDTNYSSGHPGYIFTQNAIDDARAKGIKWVIVGQHKNCLTAATKSCEIGASFTNLLVSKKVDLVLQGHDHAYERSKQLTCFTQNQAPNPACIADDGSDGVYVKGAGTIFVIAGMGGQGLYGINSSDSEVGYFTAGKLMGSNLNPTYGFINFDVTDTQISARFVKSSGSGNFTDDFVITSSGVPSPVITPSPTATLRPSPTTTPMLSVVPTPVCDAQDVNCDGKVNTTDMVVTLARYNTNQMTFDVNRDGKVNMMDVVGIAGKIAAPVVSSTPAPIPTGIVSTNFQPTAPYYATFFYPWSTNPNTSGQNWTYWNDLGNNPPNTWFSHYLPDYLPAVFDPANELYSSTNDNVLKWQLGKLKEAKQEVAISSWWGQGHKTDTALAYILRHTMNLIDNPYPNLRWAIYYEKEGAADPTLNEIISDLNYIADNYASDPVYFKVGGKPVVFVYGGASDTAGYAQKWEQARAVAKIPFYVVLKVFPGYTSYLSMADSWHEYAPAVRTGSSGNYYYFVSPGFWLDDGSAVRLNRDVAAFRTGVTNMVNSNATWKMTQTWNEWGEGSSVEPGTPVRLNTTTGKEEADPTAPVFGNAYIDILNQLLPPLQ